MKKNIINKLRFKKRYFSTYQYFTHFVLAENNTNLLDGIKIMIGKFLILK